MIDKLIRIYIYILAGIAFALLGWNLGQFLLFEVGLKEKIAYEIVMLPCVTIILAIGIVLTEVFLSNPTRPKLNFRVLPISLGIAAFLGLIMGIISGGLAAFLNLPPVHQLLGNNSPVIVRVTSWLLIGWAVGLAESFSWLKRCLEARETTRFQRRLRTSLLAVTMAGVAAGFLFEFLRKLDLLIAIRNLEEPLGLAVLGLCLGIVFGFSTSPSYMTALRVGAGFEFIGPEKEDYKGFLNKIPITHYLPQQQFSVPTQPSSASTVVGGGLLKPLLSEGDNLAFVGDPTSTEIEEGLSIQLPADGIIIIGNRSNANAHIQIEGIPEMIGSIKMENNQAFLVPQDFNKIEVNGQTLDSRRPVPLKHNTILTFYAHDGDNFFRFVYYNRFLDPLA